VVEHGVTIHGTINLASTVPYHASQMYARNVSAFLIHLLKDGALRVNVDDPIVGETLLTRGGDLVHPRVREFCSLPPLGGSRSA
jgi:NAD(P) transhydrogenase subunit alpha